MKIAILPEPDSEETRVSLVPETVGRLTKAEHSVTVAAGAGERAGFADSEYADAGATVASGAAAAADADVAILVGQPTDEQISTLRSGGVLIGLLDARQSPDLMDKLAGAGVTAISMELIPRISRAQGLDVLSSQASLAGYKAVLMAAGSVDRFFPLMITAAGTISPATVVVLGAGVAGLQAIATAKRLGAIVEAYDVRAVVKEQVESLGAKFIEVESAEDAEAAGGYAREQTDAEKAAQRDVLAKHLARADVIITTAQIPGRAAPELIDQAMVESLKPGSVVVDLAAESGGNCAGTVAGETVEYNGVRIIGPKNLPGTMPGEASTLYSRNVKGLLDLLVDDEGGLKVDMEDEVIVGAAVTHGGQKVGAVA